MSVSYGKYKNTLVCPQGNGDIGERLKCRQAKLEWMKFVRAEIKLTSPGMTDSKTFGPFSARLNVD